MIIHLNVGDLVQQKSTGKVFKIDDVDGSHSTEGSFGSHRDESETDVVLNRLSEVYGVFEPTQIEVDVEMLRTEFVFLQPQSLERD